jgi:uncharacterized protein YcbK (DUF882 family)
MIFNISSTIFIALIAAGWVWSIAHAADDMTEGVPSAAGIISRALTDSRSPNVAYLTGAALDLVTPMRGESGKLRATQRQPGESLPVDSLPSGVRATYKSGQLAESTSVASAPERTGIWSIAVSIGNAIKPVMDFSVITLKPASAKQAGKIGLYYIGNWPSARGGQKNVRYEPPSGFIEVTREQQNTLLSEHFRLKDFFPHDQQNVWPKYIVVDMKNVDKLELILAELEKQGIPARGVHVMSGFRTPQYNAHGGDPRGRASLSRHMYGDAADIFIDNDGDGTMDDLNHDGRININDARVILAAANRVEAAHPSLIGGVGVYKGTGAHGPFTHIDTRGYPARWIGTGD